jgi:hypothetical protein
MIKSDGGRFGILARSEIKSAVLALLEFIVTFKHSFSNDSGYVIGSSDAWLLNTSFN